MNDVARPSGVPELRFEHPAKLELEELSFVDAFDDLFRVEIRVRTRDHDIDPRELVGTRLDLALPSPAGSLEVASLIASARQESSEETGVSFFHVVAVPPFWLATQRSGCAIFQRSTVVDIVGRAIAAHEGRVPAPDLQLAAPPAEREYTTQYRESDWDFLHRLFADEGIAMAARHDGSGRVVLTDDTTTPLARVRAAIPFVPRSELRPAGQHVHAASFESALAASTVTLRDYDFERPRLLLEATAASRGIDLERPLERYGFEVGAFRDRPSGERRAQLRLEEARREHLRAIFETSFALAPGTAFALVDHPRAGANQEWLVIRSETHTRDRSSRHRLDCVPLAERYRPPVRPKPRVIGTQTAFVVASRDAAQEIDVDVHGRVLVRFPWDRRGLDVDTSRRVRVSQGWAGQGHGFVCLPRVGDEVVVDFLDGDPDQPIIVGRVHNGVALPPQQLPLESSRSTWRSRSIPGGDGYNEITFDDAAGRELVYLRAQRDLFAEVLGDARIRVDGHVDSDVGGNASGGVAGDGSLEIAGDAKLDVSGKLAVHAAEITAAADSHVTLSAGDQRHDESCNHFVRTSGFWVRGTSAVQFVTPNFHVFSGNIRLIAGGSEICVRPGGITIKSAGPVTVNGSVVKLNC